ncbi:group-specific protein [Aquibacillus halophilus]|uniref:Group-specific protein n=1 Tax=Aquibacillus halophilus TaxID=930132 RepID=A0A6A8D6Y4_9BACI|nr:nucleoside 2-deoxyribosyltransferase [Aquibacillus halophilus]MRH41348.1 group-specific protein [Aquibacillus halophilus]
MNFYIASGLQNRNPVRKVAQALSAFGLEHTYDWTQNQRGTTLEMHKRVGEAERAAIVKSDFVVVILPGGKGTHTEFGMALGLGKRIYVYSETDDINDPTTTTNFYHISGVTKFIGELDELIAFILENESSELIS